MILIDIGNTSLQFALIKNARISRIRYLDSAKATKASIKRVLSHYPKEAILLCSVAPKITRLFKTLGKKTYIVGENIKVPLKCSYNKKKVGMDRLVAAFAAKKMRPSSRLIIDFGTAITFDFLSKKNEYLGGLILPGLGSTLRVLSSCALLPKKIELKNVKALIPKDTQSSISKGIKEGFSHMINSLFHEYKRRLKLKKHEVPIITGGDAKKIIARLNFPYTYEPLLVLKGLGFLSRQITVDFRK